MSKSEPFAPAGTSKPDPDEPWRYACVECGSVAVVLHDTYDRPHGRTFPNGRHDIADAESRPRCRCGRCGQTAYVVRDKKENRTRSVTAVLRERRQNVRAV